MEMPDKIWVHIPPKLKNAVISNLQPEDVEYIRKDALLEWAKEQKEDEMANFPYVLDMLIDKLNSM